MRQSAETSTEDSNPLPNGEGTGWVPPSGASPYRREIRPKSSPKTQTINARMKIRPT